MHVTRKIILSATVIAMLTTFGWIGQTSGQMVSALDSDGLNSEEVDNTIPNPEWLGYREFDVVAAPAPLPARKFRLTWSYIEKRSGNAALSYNRFGNSYEGGSPLTRKLDPDDPQSTVEMRISELMDLPPEEMPLDEAKELLGEYFYQRIMDATRHEYCDFDYRIRESREPFAILLPEVSMMRGLARALALKARVEILEGDYADAVETIKSGVEMARHTAETPFLVSGLVGTAIYRIMHAELELLIQQPDAPNMYWALSTLPRPIIDYREALECESDFFFIMFPQLHDLDRKFDDLDFDLSDLQSGMNSVMNMSDGGSEWQMRGLVAAMALKGYPAARDWMIELGFTREEVESRPLTEVVVRYAMYQYELERDEMFKWLSLPYWQAIDGIHEADVFVTERMRQDILPIGALLLPAIGAVHSAQARQERDIDLLRIVEAIRMHADANDGRLPATLDEITIVPIPFDVSTGKPFSYRVEGETAILESGALDQYPEHSARHYRITIVDPE